jgi:hypothetical protein
MARLKQTPHLTSGYTPAFAAIVRQTHAGMAHFADGPLGAVCADCVFYGAWKRIKNASGEIVDTKRVRGACDKYRQLTGKLGPAVPSDAPACKYFVRKEAGHKEGERDL